MKGYDLMKVNNTDLGLLLDCYKKHKGRAPKFYDWLEAGLRREHVHRLLIETDQLAGAPVRIQLPKLGVLDLREAINEASRIGQGFLAVAKKADDGEHGAAILFGEITRDLLFEVQLNSCIG